MINDEGIITLNIREYMDYGLSVYDVESKKVGTVDSYDLFAGYMMVRSNPLLDKDLYVPFRLVSHIDPREVFVSKSKDQLHHEFGDPPPRSTLLEARVDPDTGEDKSRAITSEPNGYDGMPVIVDEAEVGEMAHHIAPGFHVYTSEMEDIGTVKEYDRERKRMLVEQGVLNKKHDRVIPVALVEIVNREDRDVILAVSSADLRRQSAATGRNVQPEEVVVEAGITETR